jgi:hypothetical protein
MLAGAIEQPTPMSERGGQAGILREVFHGFEEAHVAPFMYGPISGRSRAYLYTYFRDPQRLYFRFRVARKDRVGTAFATKK